MAAPRVVRVLIVACLLAAVAVPAASVPAQEASPVAGAVALLEVAVDRAALPSAEGFFILGRSAAEPGARHTVRNPGEVGTILIVVESGTLTYQVEGEGRILRGAGGGSPTEEPAPAGTPFQLAAGDALVHPARTRVEANEGTVPAVYLWAVILEPIEPPAPDPANVGVIFGEELARDPGAWPDLPPGPVAISLRRETIAAGAILPAPAGGTQAVSLERGFPGSLVSGGQGEALNIGAEAVEVLVLAIAPAAAAATPAAVPPVASPIASPAGEGVAAETVCVVVFPAAYVPAGEASASFWLETTEAGVVQEFLAGTIPESVAAGCVRRGAWVVRAEGDAAVVRGGAGPAEAVPDGTEVRVEAGDAVVFLANAAAQTIAIAGPGPAEALGFGIFSTAEPPCAATGTCPSGEPPAGAQVTGFGFLDEYRWGAAALAGGDLAVTVRRLELPPGATLASAEASPALRYVEAGAVEWSARRAGGPTAALRFGPTEPIPWVMLPAGNTLALRNVGAETAVVWELTLAPATPSAATPVS